MYTGGNPLNYRSAPSGTVYLFDPGVPQKVQKTDEKFFKGMANAPNSMWECVGIKTKVEKVIEGDGK